MTRQMRSTLATMQVLAAMRGDTDPPAGLTVDFLLSADNPCDPMDRRIPRPSAIDAPAARTLRYPRPRPRAAFARG